MGQRLDSKLYWIHRGPSNRAILKEEHLFIFVVVVTFAEFDQETSPVELPISGDPLSDVSLDLVFPKGTPYFSLNGKRLQLLSPLDRDKDNLSHIVFQVHSPSRYYLLTNSLVQLHFVIINRLDLQQKENDSYRVLVYIIRVLFVWNNIFTLTMWIRLICTNNN